MKRALKFEVKQIQSETFGLGLGTLKTTEI